MCSNKRAKRDEGKGLENYIIHIVQHVRKKKDKHLKKKVKEKAEGAIKEMINVMDS